MADLKPCPFCGGTELTTISVYGEDYYVECRTCTTCGPSGETEEEATEAWNRRAEPQKLFDTVSNIDWGAKCE